MIGQRKKLEKRQMLDFDWSTQIPKGECKKSQILLMPQTCKDDTAQIEMSLVVMCHS